MLDGRCWLVVNLFRGQLTVASTAPGNPNSERTNELPLGKQLTTAKLTITSF